MLPGLLDFPLAVAEPGFNLLAARWQMAVTLGAHIILAVFGVAMPVLLLVAEWRYLVGGDPEWKKLSTTPGYTNPEILTNITNVFLRPTAYSQI